MGSCVPKQAYYARIWGYRNTQNECIGICGVVLLRNVVYFNYDIVNTQSNQSEFVIIVYKGKKYFRHIIIVQTRTTVNSQRNKKYHKKCVIL